MPAPASRSSSSPCPVAATDTFTQNPETALDKAAFGSQDAQAGPNANNENGSVNLSESVEQRRWLLLRAVELMDKREQSALRQWWHYRCPAPGTLVAPARHEDGRSPVYRLDHREQRCSCPDQAFCDAFNAKCREAGLPAWARLSCKHHRIAQLLSTWRSEFGAAPPSRALPPSYCAQEEPQGSPPPAPDFQEKP